MSQWDFGYGREPTEHHEPQYPQYPYPEQQEPEYPYAQGAEAAWSYDSGQPASSGQPANAAWPEETGWPADGGWPDADGYAGSGEAYDPPAEYPITYERDAFEGRGPLPATAAADVAAPSYSPPSYPAPSYSPPSYSPRPDAHDPGDRFGGEPRANRWRPPPPPAGDLGASNRTQVLYPDPPAVPGTRSGPAWQPDGGPWRQDDDGARDDGPAARRRWLIPVGLAVAGAAVGAAIVMFALGHARAPSGTASPGAGSPVGTGSSAGPAGATGTAGAAGAASAVGDAGPTPVTLAAAKSVLSAYTSANNSANARRSAATLATVETGGSLAIDTGLYTVQTAEGAAPYPAFTPVAATYYIPRAEPADGTRWFVVLVSNAFTADPNKVTSTEYLLFTRAATGGAWQNAVEPYLLTGAGAPQIAVGGGGLATAVTATTTSLAVPPAELAARTATSIDGTGRGTGTGVTVTDPGALADRSAEAFWRGKLPTATVTDAHAIATGTAGQTFALLTTGGGALVFYAVAAELTITPPAGSVLHLTVPGLYSSGQALPQAGLSYLDQFAAADPPAGTGAPRVVAAYSGITGKN
jgi:hypothetical protein